MAEEADRVRRRLIVRGRVQGVFYRDSCRREAEALAVDGSVRNRPDGAVEVVAEGERAAVERLVGWCRTGPPHARVTAVEETEEEPAGARGFRVLP
jgi:acylphosphatase